MDTQLLTLQEAADKLKICRMTFYTDRKKFGVNKVFRESDGAACVRMEDVLLIKKKRGK